MEAVVVVILIVAVVGFVLYRKDKNKGTSNGGGTVRPPNHDSDVPDDIRKEK